MPPDEPTEEERQQELPEDNQTPFNPAAPQRSDDLPVDDADQPTGDVDDTHPSTDTDVQPEEVYESGVGPAAGVEDPGPGAVADFTPPDAANDTPPATEGDAPEDTAL